MENLFNYTLKETGALSQLAIQHKLFSLRMLLKHVKQLPYERISDKNDLTLTLKEQRGTCSTKHAFVAAIAEEQQLDTIQLMLGIYKMNEANTKGVAPVLSTYQLPFMIEAHTYLKLNGKRFDLTSTNEQERSFVDDLLHEEEIKAQQITQYKDTIHRKYMMQWKLAEAIPYSIVELWQIREACIEALSIKKP